MIEKTLTAIESAIAAVSRYTLGKDFTTYCDLRTVIGLTEEDEMLRPPCRRLTFLSLIPAITPVYLKSRAHFASLMSRPP
ncbi:hypothetical protein [Candidatus Fukatsuia symbiotica]|uniref:hypothetical protein n=1 Tax=Candidatus Fukatsuia symbiotica TaxID=1878942 RepID=UPI003B8A926A